MNIKRVLIVDDDPINAIVVRDMLAFLGDDYVFEIAYNGHEAIAKVKETYYDLVITDYHMPGLTGMNLIEKIRHISPDTQVILMTAQGSKRLEKVAKYLSVDEYITKPFLIKNMREMVQLAMARTRQTQADEANDAQQSEQQSQADEANDALQSEQQSQDESPLLDDSISELLMALKAQTGVRSVLLVSSEGYAVDVAGEIAELDISSASALVAASFTASSELARLLGYHNSTFNATYYEGDDVNIYSYDINGKMLLVVVFDIQIKPGLVSYYSKQTIANLAPLLAQQPASLSWGKEEFDEALIAEQLDELFKIEL